MDGGRLHRDVAVIRLCHLAIHGTLQIYLWEREGEREGEEEGGGGSKEENGVAGMSSQGGPEHCLHCKLRH